MERMYFRNPVMLREDRKRELELCAEIATKNARIAELENAITEMYETVKRYAASHGVTPQ